ncbi:hypothetical protein HMPREF9554_01376 [Treponema phagedenis F0421]|nr:hypothetical protein HMPREF9554_01376 [Treponema phagedenis F0421]
MLNLQTVMVNAQNNIPAQLQNGIPALKYCIMPTFILLIL